MIKIALMNFFKSLEIETPIVKPRRYPKINMETAIKMIRVFGRLRLIVTPKNLI